MSIRRRLQDMGENITGQVHPHKVYGNIDTEHSVFYANERTRWNAEVWQQLKAAPIKSLRSVIGVEIPADVERELDAYDRANSDIHQPYASQGDIESVETNMGPMQDYLGDIK